MSGPWFLVGLRREGQPTEVPTGVKFGAAIRMQSWSMWIVLSVRATMMWHKVAAELFNLSKITTFNCQSPCFKVIGSLIDLDCSEDFIKTLLQNASSRDRVVNHKSCLWITWVWTMYITTTYSQNIFWHSSNMMSNRLDDFSTRFSLQNGAETIMAIIFPRF